MVKSSFARALGHLTRRWLGLVAGECCLNGAKIFLGARRDSCLFALL
ncbi:unknown protein [Desulfotalea psychrophila LSv54]|uniref:Uncharacterized protein n=1 Tax=Desulfotalea psychrophila (strain LSv54 / DSM 12343) TaxID=177439 RepID=Q6AIZ7_DESPS|nr:unknown protein [Desulfotalea psychrophila LSv54]